MQKHNSVISIGIILPNAMHSIHLLGQLQENIDKYLSYYEILVVANPETLTCEQEEDLAQIPNIRCLILSTLHTEDRLRSVVLEQAIGDYVVLFDPEEHDVQIIEELITTAEQGKDHVGICYSPRSLNLYSIILKCFSVLIKFFAKITIDTSLSNTACYSRYLVNIINIEKSNNFYTKWVSASLGGKSTTLTSGIRKKRTLKDFIYRIGLMTEILGSIPTRMLRLVGFISLCGSLFSALFSIYILLSWIFVWNIQRGWTSTNFMLASMFSIIFLSIFVFSSIMLNVYIGNERLKGTPISKEITRTDFIQSFSKINTENNDNPEK